MILRTERLVLRPPRQDDLEALHHIFSNSDAMRYWSHLAHDTLARTQQTLDGMIASNRETGLEFVIEFDGKVIGKAGIWRLAELGYILHPKYWGQGIARESLAAILGATWDVHPTVRDITAEIDPRNMASARLLTHFGFRLTHSAPATIQINGEWCDSDYYALERSRKDNP
ncbi:Protein N-acetyltransferase, RimJ/RimL family [Aliiroseovarius halocynthiae]|uniref:GNAT family N-acetyltransferase n=1 Tax=Aliiroseovarius halocynthiae TaxID=985055 RepID=UPI001C8F7FD7|nr:GNAT family N-acetyltransferase [Aliiroseovarius halocynthiae]SMR71919.1 Protein N-acetyltransferase, RimJ/RimL family [Aliiroseovarius halocynthiae]